MRPLVPIVTVVTTASLMTIMARVRWFGAIAAAQTVAQAIRDLAEVKKSSNAGVVEKPSVAYAKCRSHLGGRIPIHLDCSIKKMPCP